jgi:hypothetical protein
MPCSTPNRTPHLTQNWHPTCRWLHHGSTQFQHTRHSQTHLEFTNGRMTFLSHYSWGLHATSILQQHTSLTPPWPSQTLTMCKNSSSSLTLGQRAIVLIYLFFQLLTMAFASLLYNTLLLYLTTFASYVTLVSPKQGTHQLTYYQSSSPMTKDHQQYLQFEFPQNINPNPIDLTLHSLHITTIFLLLWPNPIYLH